MDREAQSKTLISENQELIKKAENLLNIIKNEDTDNLTRLTVLNKELSDFVFALNLIV